MDGGPTKGEGDEMNAAAILPCRTLDAFVPDELDGIDVRQLRRGTIVTVQTRHSIYRCVIVDARRRIASVQGGSGFETPTVARIDGSTEGGSPMKMGWIGLGLRLELSVGRQRTITSPVIAIEIELPHETIRRLSVELPA